MRAGVRVVIAAAMGLTVALTAGCGGDGTGSGKRHKRAGSHRSKASGGGSSTTATPTPRPMRGDPLRFLQVTKVQPGGCASTSATTFENRADHSCLTVKQQGGLEVRQLASVEAAYDQQASLGWYVAIDFKLADAKRFGDLTRQLAGQPAPQNQLAVVLGDDLLTAPTVQEAITGGSVQISGDFSRQEAEELAGELGGR